MELLEVNRAVIVEGLAMAALSRIGRNYAQLLARNVTNVGKMDISGENVCQGNRRRLVVI